MTITTGTRTIEVRRAKRFAGQPNVYEITWRDPKKRSALVTIDEWSTADEAVAEAVANTYPAGERPAVVVPIGAWR